MATNPDAPALELRKKGFLSNDYVAEENGNVVAELSRSIWRARGEITIQGHRLTVAKQGAFKNTFTLNYDDTPIVEVTQPSALRSRLVFKHDGREFEIRSKAWYSSALVVHSGGSVVGTIQPKGVFSTRALVTLPQTLPLAVRVFVAWIAMVRWDEAAQAASG